jgi:hypothetical protein
MNGLRIAWAVLACLALAQGRVEWKKAPDGERGFGSGRSMREVERLLRSTDAEDRAFVASLREIASDVRVLLGLISARYRELGYFALLDSKEEASLERLGYLFRERAARAAEELERGDDAAVLLCRMLVDARFRARANVIDGLEFESLELEGGLALFFASLDGHAALDDREAELLARRVDLAAARLRNMRLDLEALRESPRDLEPDWVPDLEELTALARARDRARLERELPPVLSRLDLREQQMSNALFTWRQAAELQPLLEQRAAAFTRAQEILPRVRDLVPETGEHAPAEVRAQPKSRRYAEAAGRAVEALSFDPLSEELNYLAGLASDFLHGEIESRRYFDRFLALRGIRAHDDRTYRDRRLTREEARALDAVQRIGQPR